MFNRIKIIALTLLCLASATDVWADQYKLIPALGWSVDQVQDLSNASTVTGQAVAITGLAGCSVIQAGPTGSLTCNDTLASGSGDISSVTAGTGLSGGGASGAVTLDFDASELDALTWSDGANASNAWTFDVSGTDVVMTWGNGLASLTGALTASSTVTGLVISSTSGQVSLNDVTYQWPAADGTSGYLLSTNGAGGLSWAADAGGAETNSLEATITGILDDEIPLGDGANSLTYTALPDCDDSSGNHLNYDTATNAVSCGTSSSVTDTTLSQEQVEDYAGALIGDGTGTHTGIAVTYQDVTGDVDMVVDHDAASNFVANEHIDHTGVTLTAGAGLSGGGDISANRTFATDSSEADFLAKGALTCGAGTGGKMQVHTTPLQYCDNAATPALQYAAYGDSSGNATGVACSGSCVADAEVDDNITASSYLPLAGGTLTGSLVTDNLGIEFEDSDTNPGCAAGEYKIYADLSETTLKKCMNGSATDLDTTGSGSLGSSLSSTTNDILSSDGSVVLGGTGGTNNEKLEFDFETTANSLDLLTSTGITKVDFKAIGIELNASVSITLGSTTLTESTDLIINNDVEIQDATPHLRLTDSTGSEDDYEIYADASKLIVSNVTDGIEVIAVQNSQVTKIRKLTLRSFMVENLAAADDNVPIPGVNEAGTVKALWCTCHGTCTTPATITIEHSDGTAITGTATCSAAPTAPNPATISANGSFGIREDLRFDVTNSVSPETDEYTISFEYLPD